MLKMGERPMAKKLTDPLIRKIAPPKKGGPRFVFDTLATGFGVKVTPAGKRLFVLQAKYPGHKTQSVRTLGAYPSMSLADARHKAVAWYGMVRQGIDPAVEARRAAMLAQEHSFGNVAEAYIARALPGQRWAARVARQIRVELLPTWGLRPITDISRQDVVALIDKIAARSPSYARNIFQIVRSLFNWAAERYELEHVPTDRIKPKKLIGVGYGSPPAPRAIPTAVWSKC
jgi:hypothetical protein